MQIRLLGPMHVRTDDEHQVELGGAKQRALLAQLACRPNVAVSIDELAEGIWGTDVPPRYRQNIQVYVSTLRRVLEPARAAKAPSRIVGHREAYELAAGPDEIDVSRFRAATEQGREALRSGRPEAAAALLTRGLTEFRGVPLVDLADQPFAADRTTDLIEEQTSALEERIAADLARGRSSDLIGELQALVRDHPERERPWEHLMLALYRCGRQTDALAVYRQARETLLHEAGVDPGPELTGTADRILHQDPTLLALAPVASDSGAVPVPLTRAIGSEALLRRARTLIDDGARLVVLTGPGGVGKTRTGLALAEELQAAGRSVIWVPLEEVGSADEAAAEIARRLGVTDIAAGAQRLVGRTDVLLLDNLEQIPGLAAPLQRLIETVPTLQILATSRSPLGIRGERVLEIDPLEVATDAVELFAERASNVDPTFDLPARRAAATRICRSLDGLPLAIELASARMALFSADELADLLESDSAAAAELGDDTAAGAGRQGSLRALVDWSLALLPSSARRLFAHLAGCPGTVDVDTAMAIGEKLGLAPTDCRAALNELVRTALLRAVEGRVDRRFTMLKTVRSVALTDPSADPERVLSMLADHWVRRARLTDPIAQPGPRRLASAQAELSTTAAVVDFLIGVGRAPEAAEIIGANRRTYQVLGRADETLSMSLALLNCDLPAAARARVSVVAGSAAYACHREELSAELLTAGLAELAADDLVYLVLGHTAQCARLADHGESQLAGKAAELSLTYAEASSDRALIRIAHSAAGWAAIRREDFADSALHARAQLGLASDDETTMLALLDLTLAELFSEATVSATELATEAVRLAQRLGPSTPLSQAQQFLGYALLQSGDVMGGASLLVSSLRSMPANSDQGSTLESVAALGLASCILGRDAEGAALTRRANAFASELFGVDCAVIEFLLPLAERYHVLVMLPPGSPPPLGSIAELVEMALDLGTSVSTPGPQ